MNDDRLDLELVELFHAAANVEIPDGLAARVAAIPAGRPVRRRFGTLLGGRLAVDRPVGGGVRTRMQVPIGSLILAGIIVAGLFVVVPRVAPGAFAPTSQCSLPTPTATPTPPPGAPTPTSLPATPTPIGPAGPSPTTAPGAFRPVGSMRTARAGATATVLKDGRVLVVGGSGNGEGGPLTSAELYDPASCTFTSTGSMPASQVTAATLLDDGDVLFAGGFDGSAGGLASSLLFDPSTGSFSPTGSMTIAREGASATRLQDGRILIAGGQSDLQGDAKFLATAELYDPATRTFSATGSMLTAQEILATVLLADGKVLVVVGGLELNDGPATAELYDPAAGAFSPTGSMLAGWAESATLLHDGRVLVLGEVRNLPIGVMPTSLPSAELYDPKTGVFSMTGSFAAPGGLATLLQDGHVLVLGGSLGEVVPGSGAVTTAQLYDPKAGTFAPTGSMTIARVGPTVVRMRDGRVLVAGGARFGHYLDSAEIFEP
jgi:hypothetical protein